jgi:stage II sporulation protein D
VLTGVVNLRAHGESLTVPYPLRVTARNEELILAATLPVETYVEQVAASESGPADSPESLKALAIVVRSFALHQKHGHTDYDLCDSTHCQHLHWGLPATGRQAAHQAALSTAGETLWYRGERAQAWFHQNCGGRTASPSEVWAKAGVGPGAVSRKPMPWLISRTDSYCTVNGARTWSAQLSLADLTGSLAAAGLAAPGWKTLSVASRGASGRAVTLRVGSVQVSAEDFRLAVGRTLGWNKILSNWFEVSAQDGQFLFHGRGAGHGVGLCQAGAAAMSAAGKSERQILENYFPGTEPADESTGRVWQSFPGDGFTLETLTSSDAGFVHELDRALGEAEQVSGVHPEATIHIRTFASTPAFRHATLAPGWVASFTEGDWIGTQPLATLAARKLLLPTLRHEFLHALIEGQTAENTPLWLREGLVEFWAEKPAARTPAHPALKLDEVDRALAHPASAIEAAAAHHAAAGYASWAIDRYGREQVLGWLRSGVPASVWLGCVEGPGNHCAKPTDLSFHRCARHFRLP